jgi:hypothetical protein
VAQKSIATVFAKSQNHALESSKTTTLHDYAELTSSPTNFSGGRRHVDCSDCHNPHGAANAGSPGTGLHAPLTNTISASSVLAGAGGADPAAYPAPLPRNGSFPMSSPSQAGYTIAASASREFQICFKCHSSYAFGSSPPPAPSGGPGTDLAAEFNPSNPSYHPVVGAPHLRASPSRLLSPWNATTATTRMYCSDCHGNNEATSSTVAAGPHGSSNPYMLRFSSATWNTSAPTLSSTSGFCLNCHNPSAIRSEANLAHSPGDHASFPCQYCHSATPHGSFRPGLIALAGDPAPYNLGAARVVRFQVASSPSAYQQSSCFSDRSPCHGGHNNPAYAPISNANTYY